MEFKDIYLRIEMYPEERYGGGIPSTPLYVGNAHRLRVTVSNHGKLSEFVHILPAGIEMNYFDHLMYIATEDLRKHVIEQWHPDKGPSIESIAADAQKLATALAGKVKKK